MLKNELTKHRDMDCSNVEPLPASNNETSSNDKPPAKKSKSSGVFHFLEQISEDLTSQNSREKDEVDRYFDLDKIQVNDCPLSFWKANESNLSVLANLARIHLAMPATSGSVERLFSIAGAIARSRRARISIETLEKLLFYQSYLRNSQS